MAELRWALLCERVIVDATTNNPSYIEILETIQVPSVPYPIFFTVAVNWERSSPSESIHTRMFLINPANEVTGTLENTLVSEFTRHRVHTTVSTLAMITGRQFVAIEQRVNDEWRREALISLDIAANELLLATEEASAE